MVRESPLEHPSTDAVAGAASRVLGRPVAAAAPVDEGLNAVYLLNFDDDEPPDAGVLKLATHADDAAYLPEPRLFSLLADAPVPVPEALATADATETRLDAAFGVTGYCEGRSVADVLALSPEGRERLVSEAGPYLLVARAKRTGAFDYFERFAREDDDAAVARRFRSGVETLAGGLR